ncbi:MAG: hypothetical protein AAFW73_26385 [Bacteroidota bacterium]
MSMPSSPTLDKSAARQRWRLLMEVVRPFTLSFPRERKIRKGAKGLHLNCGRGGLSNYLAQRHQQDWAIGPNLPPLLRRIGFSQLHTEAQSPSFLNPAQKEMTSLGLTSIGPQLLDQGLLQATELAILIRSLRDFEQRADSMISIPSLYQISAVRMAPCPPLTST